MVFAIKVTERITKKGKVQKEARGGKGLKIKVT